MSSGHEPPWHWSRNPSLQPDLSDFDAGFALALFLNVANFTGDRKQPQVTLRLSASDSPQLNWLLERLPAGRLYGPYEYTYKDGGIRRFVQLMYRGEALRDNLLPFLERYPWSSLAPLAYERFLSMRSRYRL
jgi:hypothetical protein